jgi:hypothetical protein
LFFFSVLSSDAGVGAVPFVGADNGGVATAGSGDLSGIPSYVLIISLPCASAFLFPFAFPARFASLLLEGLCCFHLLLFLFRTVRFTNKKASGLTGALFITILTNQYFSK